MFYTDVSLSEEEEIKLGIHPKFWEQEPIPISVDKIENGFEKNSEIYNVTFDGYADDFELNQKLYRNFLYVVLENKHRDIPNRKFQRHVLFFDERDILNDLGFDWFFEKYGAWLCNECANICCLPSFSSIDVDTMFGENFSHKLYFEACLSYCRFVEKYEIEHKTKIENAFQKETINSMYSKGYRIPMNLFVCLFSNDTTYRQVFAKKCVGDNNIVGFGIVNLIFLKKERNEMDRYIDFCYRKMCKENIAKINTNA